MRRRCLPSSLITGRRRPAQRPESRLDATWRTWVRRAARYGYPMTQAAAAPPAKQVRFDAEWEADQWLIIQTCTTVAEVATEDYLRLDSLDQIRPPTGERHAELVGTSGEVRRTADGADSQDAIQRRNQKTASTMRRQMRQVGGYRERAADAITRLLFR